MGSPRMFYCRLRGAATGWMIPALDGKAARRLFAAREDLPVTSSYLVVSYKPAPGVVYGN